ncbi:hypothetical protein [Catenulispora pinisilvae]|uniref:hypothetical protein n=1 Tax=Catenulispora pinisilvae TaxID=2705253 RepID=UPI00189142C1|nr:hypothetical protein [Catenulispora pinisilvae]
MDRHDPNPVPAEETPADGPEPAEPEPAAEDVSTGDATAPEPATEAEAVRGQGTVREPDHYRPL